MSLAKKKPEPLRIVAMPPDQMMAVWPHVLKYFASFVERSRGSIRAGDLLLDCINSKRQCWIASDSETVKACALTEVQEGPMNVVLLSFCAGEDMDEWWRDMIQTIQAWAKSIGSKRVMVVHRPGWKKFLAEEGYTMTHIVSEADL